MKHIITAAALVATLATTAPASAGNSWNGHWHGCWNCGGIGPGAAVALGLGSFALGSALAYPGWWYRPYYTAPYYPPRTCWNGYGYIPC